MNRPVNLLSFKDTIAFCVNVVSTLQSFLATIFLLLTPVLYGFALSRVNLSTAYPLIIGFSNLSCTVQLLFLEESITLMKIIELHYSRGNNIDLFGMSNLKIALGQLQLKEENLRKF